MLVAAGIFVPVIKNEIYLETFNPPLMALTEYALLFLPRVNIDVLIPQLFVHIFLSRILAKSRHLGKVKIPVGRVIFPPHFRGKINIVPLQFHRVVVILRGI